MTNEKDTPEGYAFYVREFLNKPGERNVDNCINKLDIMIKTLKGLRLAYIAGSKKRGWKPKNQRKEDE